MGYVICYLLDVEAERRGILDGHGIHCATALERLNRHSFNLKQTQFIQVGETASSPVTGGGASSCANSTATGESESGERENLKSSGATASGGNETAAGGASGQTADCSNDAGPASDVGVASMK